MKCSGEGFALTTFPLGLHDNIGVCSVLGSLARSDLTGVYSVRLLR